MKKSYLEITFKIDDLNRTNVVEVYNQYKVPFLENIKGAILKEILTRNQDIQVLHCFESEEDAHDLLKNDLSRALNPYLKEAPDLRIYTIA